MTHPAEPVPNPGPLNALLRWSRRNRLTAVALAGTIAIFLAYSWCGRALVRDMYEGTSWTFLNRIIRRQSEYDLDHYQRKIEVMLFAYGTLFVLATAFFSSLWSGRRMGTAGYLLLLACVALANVALVLPVHDFGALIVEDDFPKFYSTGLENARALLGYGSPFGYNHAFQGGIPAFYLKSSFLCLIPFLSVFGEPIGHQVMLTVFMVLIPVSLYFLLRETVRNEPVAQVTAFLAAFQMRSLEYLTYGMIPAILSLSLFFLSLLFLLRYAFSPSGLRWLPAALLSVSALLYTHLVYFAFLWLVFAVIVIRDAITGTARVPWIRLSYLGCLTFLAGLPFFVSFLDHFTFFHTQSEYSAPGGLSYRVFQALRHNLRTVTPADSPGRALLFSAAFLLVAYVQTSDPRLRILIRRMFLISAILLVSPALQHLPHVTTLAYRAMIFAPFVFALNLALCLMMNLTRQAKAASALLIFFLVLAQCPLHPRMLKTVATFSEVDPKLHDIVAREDHVLVENTAHVSPTIIKNYKQFKPGPYGHWLTYLQRWLGARFFSNVGEDPHTYNKQRHMYLTNGTYLGRPLDAEVGAALLERLEEWGVNKVCVWSKPAIEFFSNQKGFSFLADSEKYQCYRAVSTRPWEVRLSGGGTGRITEATPFSMTLALENVSRPQTVTVARNRSRYWTAYDDAGREIPLKTESRMISFDVEKGGVVRLQYRKNTILYVIAALALLAPLLHLGGRRNRKPLRRIAR